MQVLDDGAGDFDEIGIYRGYRESRAGPEVVTDEGQGIGKRGLRLVIPGGLAARQRRPRAAEVMGEQRHEGEQAQQGRRGAGNSSVRPLAAFVSTPRWARTSRKVTSSWKPQDEPGDDLQRIGGKAGAQEGLRGELASWVTHQYGSG